MQVLKPNMATNRQKNTHRETHNLSLLVCQFVCLFACLCVMFIMFKFLSHQFCFEVSDFPTQCILSNHTMEEEGGRERRERRGGRGAMGRWGNEIERERESESERMRE